MMRWVFYGVALFGVIAVGLLQLVWPHAWTLYIPLGLYIIIGIRDMRSHHNVLRIYPVIGHLRYAFEFVRPEIQQYFINTNQSGRPFNREMRDLIYRRSKGVIDTLPFGTQQDITDPGYIFAYHSLDPKVISEEHVRITIGGPQCQKPYCSSRLNISAMSFGALSSNAVTAMNKGAKLGGFAQDTGEGGLSEHHLIGGGDIIWEIGTGYFGCRTPGGGFDEQLFTEKANLDVVKMIEIKLSQGAKPSHGGILPGVKVSAEIAKARGIPEGEDCISPPTHKTFDDPEGLLSFVAQLRELSGGKPVGFKLCIGVRSEFMGICKAMVKTGIYPDFITVDGAEGGTGAAPLEFSNRLGTPINEAISFVHNCLMGVDCRKHITLIASGKVATGFDMVVKLALGADMCNAARAMMFSVGCIQALRCNTNTCPTGVTTQDPRRTKALVINEKYKRVAAYHAATLKSFLDICGAMGIDTPNQLTPAHIHHRTQNECSNSYAQLYSAVEIGALVSKHVPEVYAADWANADPKHW